MRKTVLTYGSAAGVVGVAMMASTLPFIADTRHQVADALGYASIVLSALLVFFGIRSYRENAGGGRLTFGRGLAVGVLITLVSVACQVVAFELVYFQLMPDFGEKFVVCSIDRVRDAGGSDAEIVRAAEQAKTLKRLYDQPLMNAALTFATSFPIGFGVALVSAAILRRRPGGGDPQPISPSQGEDAVA